MAVSSNVIRVQSGRERDSCGSLTKAFQVKTRRPTIHLPLSLFSLLPSLSLDLFSHRHTRERGETRTKAGTKGQDLALNCGISSTHTAQKQGESHHSGRYIKTRSCRVCEEERETVKAASGSTPLSFALLLVVQIKAKPVPWYVVCLHIRMPSLFSGVWVLLM